MIISESIRQLILEAARARSNIYRTSIKIGAIVDITLKKDQGTEKRVRGKVAKILTNKGTHTRGIKVQLEDGQVGRVQKIIVQ